MPHVSAKTKAKRGQTGERTHPGRRLSLVGDSEPAYIVENDKPTYVVIPIHEYERISRAAEAQELAARIDDPTVKWIKAADAALQIAGTWIAKARKSAGLTQKQLAAKLGIPQSQISRIEKNPDRTTLRTMKRIAAALDMDVAKLLAYAEREE